MDTLVQDLKYVFPTLARRPGFTAAVLLTLELGIAVNTTIFSVATGLFFGFVPALRSPGLDLVATLKEGGRTSSVGGRHGMRGTLVVVEVGLLLAGAGLLIKSLDQPQQVDKGFDETNVLTMRVPLSGAKCPEEELWRGFTRELLARAEALPGVEQVALANSIPLGGSSSETSISAEGMDVFDE